MTDSNDENHRGRPRGRTDNRRPASDRPVRARSADKTSGPDRGGDKPWASRKDDGPRKPRAAGAKPFQGKSFEGKSFQDKPFQGKPFKGKPSPGKPSPGKPFQSRGSDERPGRLRQAEGERPFRARPGGDRSPRADSPDPRLHDPDARPQRTEERANRVSAAEARVAAQASEPAEDRIAKVIARAGIASRRDVEVMIAAGRVTLNGTVLDSPAVNVTAADRITVDGEPLPARERTRLWLFNKPRGLVTTARDPEGRPTVFDNLPEDLPRVVAIGRLDINTEGLLLFTNDGGLARVIAHPDTGWLRRYRVRVHGEINQADLDGLRGGITVEGMEYGPVEAHLDRIQGDNAWITIGLREGKNREVKRILEHLGLQVNRLIRLSFGPFQLGDLEDGLVEEVRTRVLKDQLGEALAAEAGVDFESPVREPIAPFGSPKQRERAEPQHRERGGRPERGSGRERGPARERDVGRERTFGRDRDESPRRGPAHGRDEAEPERKRYSRLDPKVSVWRSGEDQAEPRRWVPRRDADPKEARTANAGRERQRVGAIQSEGRKVLVERIVSDPKDEPAPRREGRRAPAADDRPRRPRPPAERSFAGPMPGRRDNSRPSRPRRDDGGPSRPRGGPDRDRREGGDRFDGPKPFGGGPGRKPAGPGGRFAGSGSKFAGSGGKGGPRTGFKSDAKGAPKGGSRGDFAGSGYKGKGAAGAGAKRGGPGGPGGGGFKAGGPKGSGPRGSGPRGSGPRTGGSGGRPGGRRP